MAYHRIFYICNMKQYLIIAYLLMLICPELNAQGMNGFTEHQPFGGIVPKKAEKNDKLQVNLQLGSIFFTGNNTGSGFGTYILPVVTYPINNRFKMRFGTNIYQGYGHTLYHFSTDNGMVYQGRQNISTATVFVSGSYDFNPNLTIFGSAYKQFDLNQPQVEMNPQAINFEREGFTAGFNLRLTENMQINGMIEYTRGSGIDSFNPYYSTPTLYHRHPLMW